MLIFRRRSMISLLAISFLNSGGVFLALPVLTLHAYQALELSLVQIGWLSAIWPATVLCLSTPLGGLGDKLGYLLIIRASLAASVCAYVVMGTIQSVLAFSFSLLLFGCGKAALNSTIRAAMTRVCIENERERYFRLRHMLINCGGAIGPILGVYLYEKHGEKAFLASGLLLTVALAIAIFGVCGSDIAVMLKPRLMAFSNSLRMLADRHLVIWIISFALVLAAFGAYEAFIPIVTNEPASMRPQAGVLFSVNAITVVLFQLVHIRLLGGVSLKQNYTFGFCLMALGFIFLSCEWSPFAMSIVGVIIFSVGETMLFPCYDVALDRLAPENRKSLYFGAGELKQVGFLLGPIVGGMLYAKFGGVPLMVTCSLWVVIGGVLFHRLVSATDVSSDRSSRSEI